MSEHALISSLVIPLWLLLYLAHVVILTLCRLKQPNIQISYLQPLHIVTLIHLAYSLTVGFYAATSQNNVSAIVRVWCGMLHLTQILASFYFNGYPLVKNVRKILKITQVDDMYGSLRGSQRIKVIDENFTLRSDSLLQSEGSLTSS